MASGVEGEDASGVEGEDGAEDLDKIRAFEDLGCVAVVRGEERIVAVPTFRSKLPV